MPSSRAASAVVVGPAGNLAGEQDDGPFRMPVQWVNRPNLNFRGFCVKSKESTILAARVSVVPSCPSPQTFSMNFKMLPNSYCVCEI